MLPEVTEASQPLRTKTAISCPYGFQELVAKKKKKVLMTILDFIFGDIKEKKLHKRKPT